MGEAVLKLKPLSVEDYLRSEEQSPVRREYVDGQVYAHAGATDRHNRVVTNLSGHLWLAARGGTCSVYTSDMKVRISTKSMERFYYPDVMVTCDLKDDHQLYKTSPCLLAEVLSPSTEGLDRREKLFAYQSLVSLKHYLIVSPEERRVELYRRDEAGEWWYHEIRESGLLKLPCPGLELSLDEIYEGL